MSKTSTAADRTAEIIARIEYTERALFGNPLTVQGPKPPQLPPPAPEPHTCIPLIVEPNPAEAAKDGLEAISILIENESRNLRLLRRLQRVLTIVRDHPERLTEALSNELHAAHEVLNERYDTSGVTEAMADIAELGSDANFEIGTVSGDIFRFSDGTYCLSKRSFLSIYRIDKESVRAVLDRKTCNLCRPNLEAMIAIDRANGKLEIAE